MRMFATTERKYLKFLRKLRAIGVLRTNFVFISAADRTMATATMMAGAGGTAVPAAAQRPPPLTWGERRTGGGRGLW